MDLRRLPSPDDLLILLTVARLGRFNAVAETLGTTHTTISRRILALDKQLGGRTLERSPHGWELTDLGQEAVAAAEAMVRLFRDHGSRADRKRARLKYVVHDWGVDRFRAVYSEYLGRPLAPPRRGEVTGLDLHLGAHPQGDGKWWYGLSVESGRIKDEGERRLRSRSHFEGHWGADFVLLDLREAVLSGMRDLVLLQRR